MTTKLEQDFETWWEREGQEFLFALNTTTDDDIKLVAEVAWRNGAYCAEQAEQEPVAWTRKQFGENREYCEEPFTTDWKPLFAAPVSIEAAVLAEREACAKVADEELMNTNMLTSYPPKSSAAWNIAAAIRARK